jgi:hypothetical protein
MLDEIELDDTWLMSNAPENKGDNALFVRFRMHPKRDAAETEKQGRPIFKNVEYICIGAPGDKFNQVDRPSTPKDRQRFRRHYKAFKENAEDQSSGTPLSKWPLIDAAQVEELKYFNVRTVEHLALMPDGNIPNVGNISALKKHAVDFLAAAKSGAPLVQLRSELDKRDTLLAAMQRQMDEQAALIAKLSVRDDALEAVAPKKRGRPAKTTTEAQE